MCQIIVSFPATQSTKLHSVKGYIWILKAGWQEEEGVCGRESSRCDLGRKSQSWGPEVEKPTRKLHVRAFRLHLEEGLEVSGSQSAGTRWCWQLREILSASICHQDLANNVFWGILRDRNIRRKRKLKKGLIFHLSPMEEKWIRGILTMQVTSKFYPFARKD